MNNTSGRSAPDEAQGLVKELNGAHDAPSLQKAIQDTYDAHATASQDDWNTMSTIMKNSVSLKQLGLGDFVLTGVDESSNGAPELLMVRTDGVNIALVGVGPRPDATSQTGVPAQMVNDATTPPVTGAAADSPPAVVAPVQTTGDATMPAPPAVASDAPPAVPSDAPVVPPTVVPSDSAAPPAAPVADSSAPSAPATDAAPPATDSSSAASSEDPATGVAPDGSFGQNGRKMVLSSDGTQGTYTVQPGDSLWTIAEDKLSVGDAASDPTFQTRVANLVAQLTSDNGISNPDMILPGQQLTFTNLQNSAYDASSSDATSVPSSDTGSPSPDTQTPASEAPDDTGYQPANQDLTPPATAPDAGSDTDTDDDDD